MQQSNTPNTSIRLPPGPSTETASMIQNINNVHLPREVLPRVEERCQTIIPPPQFGYSWIPSDVYNYRPSFRYEYDCPVRPSYPVYAPVYRNFNQPYPYCGNPYYQYCYRY